MNAKVLKILLTGPPGCGKTTVIGKVVKGLRFPAIGFYTEEVRGRNARRIGFDVVMLNGRRGPLARVGSSGLRVGKYGVDLDFLENNVLSEVSGNSGNLIVLDEIGKMECLSRRFQEVVRSILSGPSPVIGTVALGGAAFIREVRTRQDVELIEVTGGNREQLPEELIGRFEERRSNFEV